MAQWSRVRGLGTTEQGELCFLFGFNASGSQRPLGALVAWDAYYCDGRAFTQLQSVPFINGFLLAGVLGDTVGTNDYTNRIVGYGLTKMLGFGTTGWVPGTGLASTVGKDYGIYATTYLYSAAATAQPQIQYPLVAMDTLTATTSVGTLTKVFVRAL